MYFLILLILLGIYSGFSRLNAQDIQPVKPRITHVTVDTATNCTVVQWEESSSPDVERYFIYLQHFDDVNPQAGFVVIDSLNAPASIYRHTNPTGEPAKKLYAVAAENSSGIKSEIMPGIHGTVYTIAEHNPCNGSMKLYWNSYIGWDDNVAGYRVHYSSDGNSFTLLTGLTSKDSVYQHYGINENENYSYLVEAVSKNGLISLSNIAYNFTYMPAPPALITAEYASVVGQNQVELSFSINGTSSIENFALLRSGDKYADFIPVKSQNFNGSGRLVFTDNIITGREMFYYKLGALNACDEVIKESNLAVNILLSGNSEGNRVNLSWNQYEDFVHGVDQYIIYSKTNNENFIERARTGNGTTHFQDDIGDLSWQHSSGEMIYLVEATESGTNNTAISNKVSFEMETGVFVPNAFTPNNDGINDIFQPIFSFLPQDYTLIIYDRQGMRIFTSGNPDIGWDGTVHGRKAAEGVYMYYIEYKSFNGSRRNLSGDLTLFYPRQ